MMINAIFLILLIILIMSLCILFADPWTKLCVWFKHSNILTNMARFVQPVGNLARRL